MSKEKEILVPLEISDDEFLLHILQTETLLEQQLQKTINKLQEICGVRRRYYDAKRQRFRVKCLLATNGDCWLDVNTKERLGFKIGDSEHE